MYSLTTKKERDYAAGIPSIINLGEIDPFYYELFKGLRAKVEYHIDKAELRVLAVTSAISGEGKTLTAINLAVNMAATGRKKVLLVDMDLRKSDIARELHIAQGPGLNEFLLGSVPMGKIVQNTVMPGLYIIPGGRPISSPADMLSGEIFRSFLMDMRGKFDLVILDTPPILPVPDAITVAEQVDAFILVFRLDHTPHGLFHQAVEELGQKKIMGVVLNGEEKRADKYYHKYYGKYYQVAHTEGKRS
jgi:capsular exopolysaccharide synthesis family protein